MAVKMSFHNMSDVEWQGSWHLDCDPGLKTVKQSPASTLRKLTGKEVLWIDQELITWYVNGNMNCSCNWQINGTPDRFSVSVHFPLQFLIFGSAPSWGYGVTDASGLYHLTATASNQGSPLSLTTHGGFDLRITPTCSQSDIDLDIVISHVVQQHK